MGKTKIKTTNTLKKKAIKPNTQSDSAVITEKIIITQKGKK